MTIKEIILFTLIIVIAVIVIVSAAYYAYTHSKFDIRRISLSQQWVSDAIYKYALFRVTKEYKNQSKEVFTKKGEYRAKFVKDVDELDKEIVSEICDGLSMSDEFCRFVEENVTPIRKHKLPDAIGRQLYL